MPASFSFLGCSVCFSQMRERPQNIEMAQAPDPVIH
jgi:hypothetical protein